MVQNYDIYLSIGIIFDIHVIEIADNLYMFKIVFDDVTTSIGEGVDHVILIAV